MASRQWININAHRQPILLDTNVFITDAMNDDTMATLTSSRGHAIKVSFWISQPPALSNLSFHCQYSSVPKYNNFDQIIAKVVGAEGSFILLTALASPRGINTYDYFMYKASGCKGESSLEQVPLPSGYSLPVIYEFGIIPRGCKQFDLAALDIDIWSLKYSMYIYSSKDANWRIIPLVDPYPEVRDVIATKVITIAEDVLGWVDFDHGMMICNLREETPSLRYVPLPTPLPQNWYRLKEFLPGTLAKSFRDLICINSVISFVEMEHRVIVTTEKPSDPSKKQILHDSDLIVSYNSKDIDKKPEQLERKDGWRIVSWVRPVLSNCWEKSCEVDSVDFSGLTPVLYENLASPTLDADDGDTVYLLSRFSLGKGHIVGIDLRRKRVKVHAAYSFRKHDPYSLKACLTWLLPPDDSRKRPKLSAGNVKDYCPPEYYPDRPERYIPEGLVDPSSIPLYGSSSDYEDSVSPFGYQQVLFRSL